MAYTSEYAQNEMAKSVAGPGPDKGQKKKARKDKKVEKKRRKNPSNYVDREGTRHVGIPKGSEY